MEYDSNHKAAEKLHDKGNRIDDLRNSINNYIVLIASIVAIIAIGTALNFNYEKNDLKDWKDDLEKKIDKRLGEIKEPPDIDIYTPSGEILNGNILVAQQKIFDDVNSKLQIKFLIKNVGKSRTGYINGKIYANDPIKLNSQSSDSDDYGYETVIHQQSFKPNNIPPGLSTKVTTIMQIDNPEPIPTGVYPVMLKLFFGDDIVRVFNFNFKIINNDKYYHYSNTYDNAKFDPKLVPFDENGSLLHGQELKAYTYKDKKGFNRLCFGIYVKNIGKSYDGYHSFLLFTNDPLMQQWESFENDNFKYQSRIHLAKDIMMHKQYNAEIRSIKILSDELPEIGSKHQAGIKISCSKSDVSFWNTNFVISNKEDLKLICKE